jgi:hypothetical protein
VNIAILPAPFGSAVTVVVADAVVALPVLTGIVGALVARILLALGAGGAGGTDASVSSRTCAAGDTGATVLTRIAVTTVSAILAIGTVEAGRAHTTVSKSSAVLRTLAAVLARVVTAKVPSGFAVLAREPGMAIASIVVGQLNTFLGALMGARVGQALVDISFTARPDETRSAATLIATNLVHTSASMVASTLKTLIDVDLAEKAHGPVRTRATEIINQIVADAAIATRVGRAVVDVEFAVLPLEARWTLALVSSDKILACSSILTRLSLAFVHLLLAIATVVTLSTAAFVAVSDVAAFATVLAQAISGRASHPGGHLATDLADVTQLSRPAVLTITMEGGPVLAAAGAVFARVLLAPVD